MQWASDIERFYAKVDQSNPDGCHEWLGGRDQNGYAIFSIKGKAVRGARWLYQQVHGPFAPGYEPDHTCSNPPCVRIEHLEAVTRSENTRRSRCAEVRRARMPEKCPKGHDYDAVTSRGNRKCSTCARDADRRYRAKKVAGA